MNATKTYAAIGAVVAAELALGPTAAFAQGGLEEIVVTATRRELNLQDVPISVVAITGEDLEMRGIALKSATDGLTLNTEFSQAPETTGNLGFQHTANLGGGGTFTTRIDYSYSDQFWRSQIPNFRTEYYGLPSEFDEGGDYGLWNMRLAYVPSAAGWELAVFGTNLTDEYYLNSGFFHSLWDIDFATVGRPRVVGVELKVRFH